MYLATFLFASVTLTILSCVSAKNPPFVDCDPLDTSDDPYRVCCTDDMLPNGCECFDVMKDTDFINTVFYKPKCPCDVNPGFYFYDRDNQVTGIEMKAGPGYNFGATPFDSSRNTVFFVHGWSMSYLDPWVIEVKDELLAADNLNVILVDWKDGASIESYEQSAANTRVVGAALGKFLQDLTNVTGQSLKDVYLIGFSMGTHVVGSAGKEVHRLTGKKVGRITGLDPAGRDFEIFSPNVRLDKSDALFVDTIHTDASPVLSMGLGMATSIGHVDFFVNGAEFQPGCPGHPDTPIVQYDNDFAIVYAALCNHGRAIDYFRFSISQCTYTPDIRDGKKCTMGYHLDRACRGDFNVTTLVARPYC